VKESWDVMWRALKDHENGHLDIFMRGFEAITRSLEEARGLEGGEVKRQLEQATDGIQQEHDQYDTKTEHGQAAGVVWNL
jgi:predicted secreted Zn-dependent protease